MYELGYCSPLLLLCERKLMTFSIDKIRYEYDVFSRSKQVLQCNSSVPAEYSGGYSTAQNNVRWLAY